MASNSLLRSFCLQARKRNIITTPCSLTFVRHAGKGYWNPDWRADSKIPQTQEEKEIAARKYNLHPADYKTFNADDLRNFGDYPNLPAISYSERDPYEAWDYPVHRRNFGEPLHIDFDMYTGDRVGTERKRHSLRYMLTCCIGFTGAFFAFCWYTNEWYTFQTQMPKQYPYNDLWVEKGGDPSKTPIFKNYKMPMPPKEHGGHH